MREVYVAKHKNIKTRMAVVSAGFVPVPAVDGGAGEVLTTEIIEGNEKSGNYYMDIYTIESPKLNDIKYKNAEIIQIHITKLNWFLCKFRNMFLKFFKRRYRFIPYNRALLKVFRDNYDVILIENNMQVYEDIYNHAKNGTDNMIYHMHNDIDGTTKPEYLCEFIAKTAKVILPVSNYIKNHFYEVAPNDKMKVLYNCVDLDVFDANKEYNTKELKTKYNIKEDDFVFMYTGRICPEKGILELIQAFKQMAIEHENVKLLIVGSRWYNLISKDDYFNKLEQESKGLEDKIIFTGYVYPKDMPAIYSVANVVVVPTLCEEAFGMVALEAMAMKLPIICTNVGGLPEVVDKRTGILIDKNEDLIKNLLLSMKENKALYNEKLIYVDEVLEIIKMDKGFNKQYYYENFIDCT